MAGTVTQTHSRRGSIGVITLTCTGDATNGTIPDTDLTEKISGKLLALETDPGATAPTTLYDLVINDQNGLDVLHGAGANRSATATEKVAIPFGTYFAPPVHRTDTLTLSISNQSVASAGIVIKLYYEGVNG